VDLSRSSLLLFCSKAGNAVLTFVGIAYFTHRLPADELGVFFLFLALQGLFSIPADFGMSVALEKRLSEGAERASTLGTALAIKVGLLAVAGTVILLARPYVNGYLGGDLAVLLAASLVLRGMGRFYVHALRGRLRVGETGLLEVPRQVTWLVGGAILTASGFGLRGLVYAYLLGSAIVLVLAYARCDVPIGRPSLARARSLVAFSKYDTVSAVGGHLYEWIDTAIIGLFFAHRYVSAYNVAWQITLLVLLVSKPIALSLFPQISEWDANASTARIGETVSKALGFATVVAVPAVVGAAIYAPDILRYLFGQQYVVASGVLVVLLVEKLFVSLNDVVGFSLRAIDRPDLAARATVVTIVLVLVLSVAFVIPFGFVGVAVALTVAWFVNATLYVRYLARHVPLRVPYRLVGWYVVASVCMGGVLLGVKAVVPVTGLPTLVGEVGLGAAVYASVAVSIPAVRERVVRPGLASFGVSH